MRELHGEISAPARQPGGPEHSSINPAPTAHPIISFVVPAHNEEASLPQTLTAIHSAAREVGRPYEIVVANDASTDATAEIARQHGAIVVPVNHRQIAATRNSGARAAKGQFIFFVDADTWINARAVASALQQMEKGAVGGGAAVDVEGAVPLYIRLIALVSVIASKIIGFTGGAFMFCTSQAFHATGGFNEKMFWGEEGGFALRLKRHGRFAVLWTRVITSGRRFRTTSGLQVIGVVIRTALSPFKMFTRRASVQKLWYDSNRTNDNIMPSGLATRLSNGIAFLLLLILVTGPAWSFVPKAWVLFGSPLWRVKLVCATVLCHVGLVFWPFAGVLLFNIWRLCWPERLKMAALIAFCLWQGWASTRGMISLWDFFLS